MSVTAGSYDLTNDTLILKCIVESPEDDVPPEKFVPPAKIWEDCRVTYLFTHIRNKPRHIELRTPLGELVEDLKL
jgi:hypothetical protein